MDSDTYRPFDPWRPTPVKEESRKQIVGYVKSEVGIGWASSR